MTGYISIYIGIFCLSMYTIACWAPPTGDHNRGAATSTLLISDSQTHRIYRVDLKSGIDPNVLVGPEVGGLHHPDDMVIDHAGRLYVGSGCQAGDCDPVIPSMILRFDAVSGNLLDTFAQDDNTPLKRPYGLTIGSDSILYVASFLSDQILKFDIRSRRYLGILLAGDGKPSGCNGPNGLLWGKDRNLYVTTQGSVTREGKPDFSDGFPSQLLRIDPASGNFTVLAEYQYPVSLTGLAQDYYGSLYVSNYFGDQIRIIDPETGIQKDSIVFAHDSLVYHGHLVIDEQQIIMAAGQRESHPTGAMLVTNTHAHKPNTVIEMPLRQLKRPFGMLLLNANN